MLEIHVAPKSTDKPEIDNVVIIKNVILENIAIFGSAHGIPKKVNNLLEILGVAKANIAKEIATIIGIATKATISIIFLFY